MSNRCILIIDDDEADLALYKSWLSETANTLNYEIISCSNIHEGLVKYATKQPQCVVLDYQMAEGDGLEFLSTLKAQSMAAAPVIFTTAYPKDDLKERSLENGIQFFMPKEDLNEESLSTAVRDVIELTENELLTVNNVIQSSLHRMMDDEAS